MLQSVKVLKVFHTLTLIQILCKFSTNFRVLFPCKYRQHWKTLFFRGFILKPTEGAQVLPKNSIMDFRNSPLFGRSACFYVTISENFLENENLFQKTGALFSS